MDQYQRDLDIDLDKGFWRGVGYEPSPYHDLPSTEEKFAKIRWQKTGMCIQCDRCFKWRELTFNKQFLDQGFPPEHWECEYSWDSNRAKLVSSIFLFLQVKFSFNICLFLAVMLNKCFEHYPKESLIKTISQLISEKSNKNPLRQEKITSI